MTAKFFINSFKIYFQFLILNERVEIITILVNLSPFLLKWVHQLFMLLYTFVQIGTNSCEFLFYACQIVMSILQTIVFLHDKLNGIVDIFHLLWDQSLVLKEVDYLPFSSMHMMTNLRSLNVVFLDSIHNTVLIMLILLSKVIYFLLNFTFLFI